MRKLSNYVNSTNRSLEYYNSGIEYGKVVFAKYLRERFGIDFIKSFFENYQQDKTMLEVMQQKFLDANLSFKESMLEFAKWMANEQTYFKEGGLYPLVHLHSLDENISIENYGFALFDSGSTRYLVSSNPEYLQSNFYGDKEIIDSVDQNGLVLLNPKLVTIYSDITQKNIFNGIALKTGWNLVSNIWDENLTLNTIFNDDEIVWLYRDGSYFAYAANSKLENYIEDINISIPNNEIVPGEGIWVYTNNEKVLDFDKKNLLGFDLNLTAGWNLLSIASSAFDVDEINESVVIWHFNKDSQNWEFYANRSGIDMAYKKIEKILPCNGYFMLK